jgi:PAS domain S-box-containing protein
MLAQHYLRREHGNAMRQYEFRFIRKNGEIRHALITVDLIPGTTQSLASLIDITDRKLAEEQLLQREQQYRFIADNSLDVITRLSIDFLCLYASPAITPLLGYSEIELLGKYLLSLIHPDDLEQSWNTLDAVARSGSVQLTLTFRLRHKDGHYSWFESTVRIIRDEKTGRVREYLCISRDITGRTSSGKDTAGD